MKCITLATLISILSSSVALSRVARRVEGYGCRDQIKHCKKLSREYGGCQKDSHLYKYTSVTCQLTCGLCKVDSAPACEDKLEKEACDRLVSLGACNQDSPHYEYMIPNCRASCGECKVDEQEDNCQDKIGTTNCELFMEEGECHGDKYLLANCQKSCGICPYHDDPRRCADTLTGKRGRYTDPSTNCQALERAGYCNPAKSGSYYDQISKKCRKTCGLC